MKAIMVGVDGSAYSEVAVRYAAEIAELAGAGVVGLAGVAGDFNGEEPLAEQDAAEIEGLESLPTAVVEWFRRALDDCGEACRVAEVPFAARMLAGHPGRVLTREAQAADMLVLGCKGRRDDDMELLGNTTRHLIRSCIKPVLVTRREHRAIGRALVGYDGSPASGHAVEWVADLAAAGAWEVAVITGAMPESGLAEDVRFAANLVRSRGVEPEVMRVEGDAPSIIFEQMRAWKPDIVAVGGPVKGALSGFFLGEAWPEIVEQADVPVLRWR